MNFTELDLPSEVQQGIEHVGFFTCTPVQESGNPAGRAREDIAAQAQTGTGKTAAFLISLFTRMIRNPAAVADLGNSPQALIISPTRELADQIFHEAERLGKFTGFRLLAVFGGIDYQKQMDTLHKGVDVLIGTPGRLIDYYKQHVYSLKKTRYLVIDEADRMFDMGFIDDLRYLIKNCRPTASASPCSFRPRSPTASWNWPMSTWNLPEKISITPEQVTVERVEQVLYHVGKHEKLPLLLGILNKESPRRVLIFVNTRRAAEMVAERLNRNSWKAQAITGEILQRRGSGSSKISRPEGSPFSWQRTWQAEASMWRTLPM